MIAPALVGVGLCAASVLVAVVMGLLLSRAAETLIGRRRPRPTPAGSISERLEGDVEGPPAGTDLEGAH